MDPEFSIKYIMNSLRTNSPEMREIQACARENAINVSLGFSENDNNSLYISQALINSDGKIVFSRRKMKPTHMERTIFGDSSGDSLVNVGDVNIGRVGSLACWEHLQPLLKFHTFSQKEEIHVAAWPSLARFEGEGQWSLYREGRLIIYISGSSSRLTVDRLSSPFADICYGITDFCPPHHCRIKSTRN